MTKRTRHLGLDRGNPSSDQGLSPQRPYTGDGRTTRSIFDRVVVIFKAGKKKK